MGKYRLRRHLCSLILLLILPTASLAETAPPIAVQLLLLALADNAMALTHRLLNDSSAARSIKESDNAEARALREEALELYRQAEEADKQGDSEARDHALRQAKMKLFRAAQVVRKASGSKDHERDVYQRRVNSAKALLDAHQRIREESHSQEAAAIEAKAVEEMASAQAEFDKGQVDAANKRLEQALQDLKGSLTTLRNGTTLVRSLHFETPAEKYAYELDRNQSHKMMTTLLLQKKKLEPMMQLRFDEAMKKANELREKAEALAAKGDYTAAIQRLEESTKFIVRAIRSAGIYIPG